MFEVLLITCQTSRFLTTVSLECLLECLSHLVSVLQPAWLFVSRKVRFYFCSEQVTCSPFQCLSLDMWFFSRGWTTSEKRTTVSSSKHQCVQSCNYTFGCAKSFQNHNVHRTAASPSHKPPPILCSIITHHTSWSQYSYGSSTCLRYQVVMVTVCCGCGQDRALPPTPRHVSTATLLVTITDGDDLGPAFLPCQPITGQPDCAPVTYQTVIPRHAQPVSENFY